MSETIPPSTDAPSTGTTASADNVPQSRGAAMLGRVLSWTGRGGLTRKLAYSVALCAGVAGIATGIVMTNGGYEPQTVLWLLYSDLVLLLLLTGLVITKLVALWQERRTARAGSGLHTQLVIMFSLISVTPAVLVAIFAAVFINIGLQGLFSDRVKLAIENSTQVATAYLHEHQQNIRSDIFAVANDLNREAANLTGKPWLFNRVLSAQASVRDIPEAVVVDSAGQILARSQFSQSLEFDQAPDWAFEQAKNGEAVVMTSDQDDRVRAVVRLTRFVDAYLLIGRFVDPRVMDYVDRVKRSASQYQRIEEKSGGLQITFMMLFIMVAVMLLLASAWVGLTFATRFATPIGRLVSAAEQVHDGDLDVSLPEDSSLAEVDTLMRAFNRMTRQLASQQDGLLDANRQLDERRRFTETVLSGVSAGVIGLDQQGHINLPNRSASLLLSLNLLDMTDKPLSHAVPEMANLLHEAMTRPGRLHQDEIRIERDGHSVTLLARIAAEHLTPGEIIGYVVTFDDITALQSAQRQAAWADVARRIAHEIKNPLTPIQLSAERLKRKYLGEIKSDPETFQACTDTIIRQVGDIGRMVDEFSSFARMPEASIRPENLSTICRESILLERNRSASVAVEFDDAAGKGGDVHMRCDRAQMAQAITNLIKNAIEAVEERLVRDDGEPGRVNLSLSHDTNSEGEKVTLSIEDNGVGLPENERNRLTEPYVTTRDKGTGLGLAIVKKIVEEHGGELWLSDAPSGGARISMVFHPENLIAENDENDIKRVKGA